ncbi:MAG: hypothetical protein L3J10_04370 [Sulfurimonas sp.]|nr:hypothetical protein [Sulfurimonas sp.]
MLVYIYDREDEELDDYENEEPENSYSYDYEESSYEYVESDNNSYFS